MRKGLIFILPLLLIGNPVWTYGSKKHSKSSRRSGLVSSAKEAKAIAEQETGGQAISARRIPLNGASCGWEVEVRMPKESRGWRCVVDCDTRTVHTKTRIEQPTKSKKKQ